MSLRLFRKLGSKFYGTGIGRSRHVRRVVDSVLSGKVAEITIDNNIRMVIEPSRGFVEKTLFFGNGVMEPRETKVFIECLRPDSVVVDIGAHIGYYTLLAAKYAKKVYAFEPLDENYVMLQKNIKSNSFTNVIVEKKAASDKKRRLEISFERKKSIVPSVTLDQYFGKKRIDLVKIDVDGGELEVLKGAKKVLNSNKGIKLLLELDLGEMRRQHKDPAKLLKYLDGLGFRFFSMNEKDFKDGCPSKTSMEEILKSDDSYFYSLFCKR